MLTVIPVSLAAGDEYALHWHDVCGGRKQRAVHPVLQAARRRGSLPGGGLEALQVQQKQPGEDGHASGGVTEEEEEEEADGDRDQSPRSTQSSAF